MTNGLIFWSVFGFGDSMFGEALGYCRNYNLTSTSHNDYKNMAIVERKEETGDELRADMKLLESMEVDLDLISAEEADELLSKLKCK